MKVTPRYIVGRSERGDFAIYDRETHGLLSQRFRTRELAKAEVDNLDRIDRAAEEARRDSPFE